MKFVGLAMNDLGLENKVMMPKKSPMSHTALAHLK